MNAAILARGPSIWRTWSVVDRSDYAQVITINTACNVFACDWVVACDGYTYQAIKYMPRFGRVFRSDLSRNDELPEWPGLRTIDARRVGGGGELSYPAGVVGEFSIETAIIFALDVLLCDRVDLYGVDLGGDCRTGEIPGIRVNDNAGRWDKERKALDVITSHYGDRIRRIQ